jgi:hypothetical protein
MWARVERGLVQGGGVALAPAPDPGHLQTVCLGGVRLSSLNVPLSLISQALCFSNFSLSDYVHESH